MVRPVVLLMFSGVLIAGGFSLERLNDNFEHLGWLVDLRTWALLPLLLMVGAHYWRTGCPRIWSPSFTAVLLVFLAAQICIVISMLWTTNPDRGIVYLSDILFLIAAVLVGIGIALRDPANTVIFIFTTFFLASCLLLVMELLITGGVAGQIAQIGAGGIGAARLHGSGLLAAMFMWRLTGQWWWLVLAPVQLASIFLSGSRAAIAALVVAAFLLVVKCGLGLKKRVSAVSMISLAVVAGVIIGISGSWFREVLDLFVQSMFVVNNAGGEGIYLADREVIFIDAWMKFLSYPLGGMGLGSYDGPFGEEYPHNLVLNYAVDGGVVPFVLLLAVVIFAFVRFIRASSLEVSGALCMSSYFFAASMFAGTYYDARSGWVFLLIGLIPVVRRKIGFAGGDLRQVSSSVQRERLQSGAG